jgi:CSLREA domain-containing protein
MLRALTAGAAMAAGFATAPAAQALDITVTSTADDNGAGTTLREAVAAANGTPVEDRVLFAPEVRGTIELTGVNAELDVTNPIQILGPGSSALKISGIDDRQIFYVHPAAPGTSVLISGLTLTRGEADNSGGADNGQGGAIRNTVGGVTLDSVVLSENNADRGGAIQSEGGSVNIVRSTLVGNHGAVGGAMDMYPDADLALDSSTVTGNTEGIGGTIGVGDTGQARIVDSTIAGNQLSGNQGTIWAVAGHSPVLVLNSIIAGNGGDDFNFFAEAEIGHSLIGDPDKDDPGELVSVVPGSNLFRVDPQLGPLAVNGGPTPTMMPALTSPVLDKGGNIFPADQRGLPRPVDLSLVANRIPLSVSNGADIGSVELTAAEGPQPVVPATPIVPAKSKAKCKKKKRKKGKATAGASTKKKCKRKKRRR